MLGGGFTAPAKPVGEGRPAAEGGWGAMMSDQRQLRAVGDSGRVQLGQPREVLLLGVRRSEILYSSSFWYSKFQNIKLLIKTKFLCEIKIKFDPQITLKIKNYNSFKKERII